MLAVVHHELETDKVGKDGAAPCVGSDGSVVLECIGKVGEGDKEGACRGNKNERSQSVYTFARRSYCCRSADVPFHAERDLSIDVGNMALISMCRWWSAAAKVGWEIHRRKARVVQQSSPRPSSVSRYMLDLFKNGRASEKFFLGATSASNGRRNSDLDSSFPVDLSRPHRWSVDYRANFLPPCNTRPSLLSKPIDETARP